MPAQIVDAYAEVSPDGRAHFPVVQAKFAEAAASLCTGLVADFLAGDPAPIMPIRRAATSVS